MGNAAPQVKPVGGAAQRDPTFYLQHDLPKLIKKNELGMGKFMKSFLCKVEDGVNVVVKVYVRHDGESQEELTRARVNFVNIALRSSLMWVCPRCVGPPLSAIYGQPQHL